MSSYFKAFRHLRAEEFMTLLDGLDLGEDRRTHVAECVQCRTTLASITELGQDISESEGVDADATDAAVANADWIRLRSSVRDRLLARAVKRDSVLQRWTGWTGLPTPVWSLALLALVTGMAVGGFWQYQTVQLTDEITGISSNEGVDLSLTESSFEFGLFPGDAEVIEAEALAWSQTEIFTSLNELESGEEDMLRELISLAFAEASIFDELR